MERVKNQGTQYILTLNMQVWDGTEGVRSTRYIDHKYTWPRVLLNTNMHALSCKIERMFSIWTANNG